MGPGDEAEPEAPVDPGDLSDEVRIIMSGNASQEYKDTFVATLTSMADVIDPSRSR